MIIVEWRVEDGEAKGQIIEDDKGRRKIVFVERSHRGRRPRNWERTEVELVRDTKPDELGKGALLVRPIFAPDPNALSREEARAQMLALIVADGPQLGESYIEVDLPGWRGTLTGKLPRVRESGPLSMLWYFDNMEDGSRTVVYSDPVTSFVLITKGIVMGHGQPVVVDWEQAIKDLGQPVVVEQDTYGNTAEVVWKDRHNVSLVAKISKDRARALGATCSDMRLDDDRKIVLARVSLLNGLWVCTEELTTQERFNWQDGTVERATLVNAVHEEAAVRAAAILRPTLHSPDWHKQSTLAGALDPANSYEQAVYTLIGKLKQMLGDPCLCKREIDRQQRYLAESWNHIVCLHELNARFATPPDGLINKIIYGQGTADDMVEVTRLTAENEAKIATIKAEIATLQIEIDKVPVKQNDPDVLMNAWCLAQELNEQISELFVRIRAKGPGNYWYLRTLETAQQGARLAIQRFEKRHAIESAFEQLFLARKELRECERHFEQDQSAQS